MTDFDIHLVWKGPSRTTTRAQWKSVSRWLRIAAHRVDERMDAVDIRKYILDTILYGTGRLRIG